MTRDTERAVEILLVEDNPGDIQLVQLLLRQTKIHHNLTIVRDGVEATDFLFKKVKQGKAPRPDFIILDLNLPRKDGREVLDEFKKSTETRAIPILVLSTSSSRDDVTRCYELHANCYVTKPGDLANFNAIMKSIEEFWFTVAELPESKLVMGAG